MTFVPIGWNVVLWGVKTRLELGQGIAEDCEAEEIREPQRGASLTKSRSGYRRGRASSSRSCARGYWRKRRTKRRDKWPN